MGASESEGGGEEVNDWRTERAEEPCLPDAFGASLRPAVNNLCGLSFQAWSN